MRAQRLQLVVVVGAVELERVEAARAFGLVEPAAREEHPHGVDAVLDAARGAAYARGDSHSCDGCHKMSDLGAPCEPASHSGRCARSRIISDGNGPRLNGEDDD